MRLQKKMGVVVVVLEKQKVAEGSALFGGARSPWAVRRVEADGRARQGVMDLPGGHCPAAPRCASRPPNRRV